MQLQLLLFSGGFLDFKLELVKNRNKEKIDQIDKMGSDKNFSTIFIVALIILGGLIFVYNIQVQAQATDITATIQISVCGNAVVEGNEQCDGSNLGGQTCVGRGYDGGTLGCNADCTFDTSSCTTDGGGGGGGGWTPPPTETKVILQGKAYSSAEITILIDGRVSTIITADSQANFKTKLTDLTGGVYTFSLWAEDKEGRRSITFSFTVNVTEGRITTASGIFIPPTIELEKTLLKKGEILNILGQTAPESELKISVESPGIVKETKADIKGDWSYPFNTTILEEGSHVARAKAELPDDGLISSYSKVLSFYIGEGVLGVICPNADLNNDGKVNLVDFSILLYWWGKTNSCADQNQNGVVDLADFSIMLYYWTG